MRSVLAAFALALAACPAFAASVELRERPVSHGGSVTLGDLFDGAGAAADTVVGEAAPVGGETVLEAGRVQAAALRAGLDWANPQGRRRIVVGSTDAPRSAPSPARAHASRERGGVLAYARSLNTGEVVAASDLTWSDEAVAPADAPADADRVIGLAARRPLREGAAVGAHDLAAAKVITRGDQVDVAFEEDGVTLVLQAKALADAAVGDSLTLTNLQSHKPVEAVASAPGRAVVGARADALRAAARAGLAASLSLASR